MARRSLVTGNKRLKRCRVSFATPCYSPSLHVLKSFVFLPCMFSLGIISSLMDHTVDSSLKFLSEHCQPVLTSGYGSTNKPSKTAAGVHEVQTLLRYLSAIYDRHILREDEDSQMQMINQKQRQSVSSISSRQSSGISASDTGRVVSSFAFAFVWAFGGHLHERYNKLTCTLNVIYKFFTGIQQVSFPFAFFRFSSVQFSSI